MFALSVVVAIGLGGMSIDGARALNVRTLLQDAADAAALAAVSDLKASESQQVQIGHTVFMANLNESVSGISSTPTVAPNGDRVTVSAAATVDTLMLGVLNISEVPVGATATAIRPRNVGRACVLALDPAKSGAVSLAGGARLSASGCVVHANSKADDALTTDGTSTGMADAFCAVGGYAGPGFAPTPYKNCMKVVDPFAALGTPDVGACDHTNKSFKKGTHVAQPGVYCGGISFETHTEVTLSPGVYIIKDGPLTARAHSSVAGDGVVFYLMGTGAVLDIKSGADLDLKAPTSGEYAGLIFVQDPNSSAGATSAVEGGGAVRIVGGFYLPTQQLDIGGGGDIGALSPFMPIIANDIVVQGNGELTVNIDHSIAGMPNVLPEVWAGMPRLIN